LIHGGHEYPLAPVIDVHVNRKHMPFRTTLRMIIRRLGLSHVNLEACDIIEHVDAVRERIGKKAQEGDVSQRPSRTATARKDDTSWRYIMRSRAKLLACGHWDWR
jgi:hypothetical protein